MNAIEQEITNRLINHCKMFLYGCEGNPFLMINEVAQDFNQFGLLHLTATMFFVKDKPKDQRGGLFYRSLRLMNLTNLLDPIEESLDMPVGETNLREYIRNKRNKMTTHGDLSFASQRQNVQDVSFNDKSLDQYEQAFQKLEDSVRELMGKLESLN